MTHQSFLGIPVEGRIIPGDHIPQRPLTELEPFIRALLEEDTITEFGWRQYTPYFNDGDPCVFDVSECWVRTTADAPEVRPGDLSISDHVPSHPSLGKLVSAGRADEHYQGGDEHRFRQALALAKALESGAFDDVLLETFGEHASVTVRRDGITVDYYDHD